MADQPFNPEDLLASVAASMPPGPQTSPVQPDQGNNPVGQMSPMSQVVNPNPAQPQQPKPQGPPTPRPILFDLMRAIKPEQQAPQVGAFGALGPQRTGNRLEHFESFLGNFLNAFATGMGAAHGPGAFGKGMSAAAAAPWQRSVEQYQLGQQGQVQQAQAQNLAAEAQLRQAQAAPVQVPGIQGNIPAGSVPTIYRGYPAAQVSAQAGIQKTVLQNAAQQELRDATAQHQKAAADLAKAGNDPNSPLFKLKKRALDLSVARLNMAAAGLAVKQQGNARAQEKFDIQKASGALSTTGTTRTMVETAPKVQEISQRLRQQIQGLQASGELGPGASRWNEAWSGKIGAANPEFRAMKTNADLLSTLLMRMHVGARGGERIMEHFSKMIDAGHQSPQNMLATLDQIDAYAKDVGSSINPTGISGAGPKTPKAGNKVLDPLGIR